MIKILRRLVFLLLAFPLTANVYKVTTMDGNVYLGQITERTETYITVTVAEGRSIQIERTNLLDFKITELKDDKMTGSSGDKSSVSQVLLEHYENTDGKIDKEQERKVRLYYRYKMGKISLGIGLPLLISGIVLGAMVVPMAIIWMPELIITIQSTATSIGGVFGLIGSVYIAFFLGLFAIALPIATLVGLVFTISGGIMVNKYRQFRITRYEPIKRKSHPYTTFAFSILI